MPKIPAFDDEFRKFANIPKPIDRALQEEKVDLSTSDIFQYLEKVLYGYSYGYGSELKAVSPSGMPAERSEPSCYEVAMSCCDALEKKGYDNGTLSKVRSYLTKMQAAAMAQRDASEAMSDLMRERWKKNEVY